MKLIENWKDAWKMRSVQVFALIAAAPAIWAQIPEQDKALILEMVPDQLQPYTISALALVGVWARIKKQPSLQQ